MTVTPDHYATLGLAPTSEDVVIRAAYRALVRRYHPDANASAAATARTRAINAAYEVLIDPDKRAQYDQVRAADAWPSAPMRRAFLPAPSRLFAAASVTLLLVLVFLVTWSPVALVTPAERATHAPPRTPAVAREIPVLPSAEEPAVVSDVAQVAVADPQLDEPVPEPPITAVATLPKPIIAKPTVKPRKTAAQTMTSASCRTAVGRRDSLVCGNRNLAELNRQQALFYSQSWLRADAARRLALQSTRDRFLARRKGCRRSVACARAAYLARLREVSEIMIVRPQPRP